MSSPTEYTPPPPTAKQDSSSGRPWELSRGGALGSGPLTQLIRIKARVDSYATGLLALSHLGQHRFLVGQPRVWKLQPSQVSHCLGSLGRPADLAICQSTHLKQVTETLPEGHREPLQLGHLHAEFWPSSLHF